MSLFVTGVAGVAEADSSAGGVLDSDSAGGAFSSVGLTFTSFAMDSSGFWKRTTRDELAPSFIRESSIGRMLLTAGQLDVELSQEVLSKARQVFR
jgi:hypothetical protein